jgi:hypothetical protein
MQPMRILVLLATLSGLLLFPATLPAQEGLAPVIVHLGDGSSLPLRPWSLSYEFSTWAQGSSPLFAEIRRAPANALWAGKKVYTLVGATLEIKTEMAERQREVDGEVRQVRVPVVKGFVVVGAEGKRSEVKLEPPHRELLAPGLDKSANLLPRSFDLKGETLTGTKREFCLTSLTALVECQVEAGQEVVKLEFPK